MILNRRFIQYLISFCFFLLPLSALCQPPIQQQIPPDMLPGNIDPKQLSPSQLSILLSDKNKDAGKDKNAKLMSTNKLEKDSLVKDNIKQNNYSPGR